MANQPWTDRFVGLKVPADPMRFDYYEKLSSQNKAIYRESDAYGEFPLELTEELLGAVAAVREALDQEKSPPVKRALMKLGRELTDAFEVPPLGVKVLAKRPNRYGGELHGLYEREEGKRALITVWMRTAKQRRVVAFRTFLRIFLHEVCHHLDFDLLELEETFHTEGFFQRESSLMRTLAPPEPKRPAAKKPRREPRKRAEKKPKTAQLSLFDE